MDTYFNDSLKGPTDQDTERSERTRVTHFLESAEKRTGQNTTGMRASGGYSLPEVPKGTSQDTE
jgi:hypothetical protein